MLNHHRNRSIFCIGRERCMLPNRYADDGEIGIHCAAAAIDASLKARTSDKKLLDSRLRLCVFHDSEGRSVYFPRHHGMVRRESVTLVERKCWRCAAVVFPGPFFSVPNTLHAS